ncbi:unnamed protein product [Arabidopsis thaliana]|uniref:(thale cress) hypothetical protein n=1 Tax=Arabidopsis thaliana TaxID=3702 RepID=A0A7G2E0B7_ARATH|nr:unnamed protein product [Arabidopsis thaliana]
MWTVRRTMERHCVFVTIFVLILHLVQAQNQTGFISVDCGLSPLESPYNAPQTGLTYTSDTGLINTGKTGRIAKDFEPFVDKPALTMRYFPDGIRNCYNLNVTRDTNYLIKATFVYGNYDGLNVDPNFDLYFGPNLWTTVSSNDTTEEIIHVTKFNSLQICLVKTGISIPFINVLELRPLKKNVYATQSGSLKYLFRMYVSNSSRRIRFPDDVYDRKWYPIFQNSWTQVTTNLNVNISTIYELPQSVMSTAATPLNANATLNITWTIEPPTTPFYSYIHFAELQSLRANDTREFNVTLNGENTFGPYSPKPLKTETIQDLSPEQFTGIKNVQNTYGLNRISWQGDPCVPKQLLWDGLNCNNSDISIPPIIISLDLSSSGLNGVITQGIQNLTHLQYLDLSDNNLTGDIPKFLADIQSLLVIVEGNPHLLCTDGLCVNKGDGHKKKSIIAPVVASIASIAILIGALVLFFVLKKKTQSKGPPAAYVQASNGRSRRSAEPAIVTKNKRFTYSEVMQMTNNFQRVLGKGGFGIVYHGLVNVRRIMERHFVFIATYLLIFHLVQAQNQTGFISVDCGLSLLESPYDAPQTGLTYTSDADLVASGKTGRLAKEFEPLVDKPTLTLRYFPEGVRNCYNLNVTRDTNYLIKATFVYGNYDGLNIGPNFNLYLGPNLWTTVSSNDTIEEIIHVTRSILYRGYISNSSTRIRFPDDVYDRKWYPLFDDSWTQVTTNLKVNTSITYELPQSVMARAATPIKANDTLNITWTVEPPTTQFYSYVHIAEIQALRANETREFNVTLNGEYTFGPFSPIPLKTASIVDLSPGQCDGGRCILQVVKTLKSTLPPLLNAIEAFTVIDFPQMETNGDDVAGIKNVQDTYGLSRISWQGDPCVPKQLLWDGLNCNNSDISTPPIITSFGLTGIITQAIKNLTHLQILDLSDNNLTGEVPEFLADIKSLLVINLSGNNLSGSVPPSLLQKKGMNLEGNPHTVCTTGYCVNKREDGHKKKSVIVPVVASIASIAVLIGALVLFFILRKKKSPKVEGPPPSYMQASDGRSPRSSEPAIVTKNRRFTYSQVAIMTNNFQRILGKGGFGMVYHGFVNGTEQVAVKILSHSSSQGYKEFKAEVSSHLHLNLELIELLLRVDSTFSKLEHVT